jgi:hypothetical protein
MVDTHAYPFTGNAGMTQDLTETKQLAINFIVTNRTLHEISTALQHLFKILFIVIAITVMPRFICMQLPTGAGWLGLVADRAGICGISAG